MKLPNDVQEVSENGMRRIAHIVSFSSSASAAIRDFEARRAAGKQPIFLVSLSKRMIYVGEAHDAQNL